MRYDKHWLLLAHGDYVQKDDPGGGDPDDRREVGVEEGHEGHLPKRNDLIFRVYFLYYHYNLWSYISIYFTFHMSWGTILFENKL